MAAKVVEVVEKHVKIVENVKKRPRADEESVGRKIKKSKRSQVWTCTLCVTTGCYECEDRRLLSATLDTHICTKSCDKCGGVFGTRTDSAEHKCLLKQRHNTEDGCGNCGSFRCDSCGAMFASTVSFNHHVCMPCKKPTQTHSTASTLYHAPCSEISTIDQQFNCLQNDLLELKAKNDFKSAEFKIIAEDKDLITVPEAIELRRQIKEVNVKNASLTKFVEQIAQTMSVATKRKGAKLTDETTTVSVDKLCHKVQKYLNSSKAKTDVSMTKADLETFTSRVAGGTFNPIQTEHLNLDKLMKKVVAEAVAVALKSSSQSIPKTFDIFGKKTSSKGTYGCDFCQETVKFKKNIPKHLWDVHQITKEGKTKYTRYDGVCWTPISPQMLNILE